MRAKTYLDKKSKQELTAITLSLVNAMRIKIKHKSWPINATIALFLASYLTPNKLREVANSSSSSSPSSGFSTGTINLLSSNSFFLKYSIAVRRSK